MKTVPVIVMGVSGCGKSVLAKQLADALGRAFIEGDKLHPEANIHKMASGIALTDEDRLPFLKNVAQALHGHHGCAIASCSALKRSYRDYLRAQLGQVVFILPMVSQAELQRRLTARADHFMPASLLTSQLATLETPDEQERAIYLNGHLPTSEQVIQAQQRLAQFL